VTGHAAAYIPDRNVFDDYAAISRPACTCVEMSNVGIMQQFGTLQGVTAWQ